jgi:hypothetical protein
MCVAGATTYGDGNEQANGYSGSYCQCSLPVVVVTREEGRILKGSMGFRLVSVMATI